MMYGQIHMNGYYDEMGNWQRTKFCFVQCQHCDCQAPGGLYYNAAYDKRLHPEQIPQTADNYKPLHGGYPE